MIGHTILGEMPREKELRLYLRRALSDSGLTQTEAGAAIGRVQTWFPNTLFANSTKAIRRLYVEEPAVFEKLVVTLELDRALVLDLAGLTEAPANATEVGLDLQIPVYPAGAGPALDDATALEFVKMPLSGNGGSYKIVGLKVHGDSMSPYLEHGDTAFIACEASLIRPGKAIGVYIPEIGSVVKNYVRTEEDGRLLLQSLNAPDDGEFFVAPLDSRIYGPVIHRLKRG